MAAQHDTTDHETETAPSTEQDVNLLVWQHTTMLEPVIVDGVAEDNVLRGID